MSGIWNFLRLRHSLFILTALFILLSLKQFDPSLVFSNSALSSWRFWVLFLLGAYLLFKVFLYLKSGTGEPEILDSTSFTDIETSLLILAIINVIIQLGGSYSHYLYPLNYLVLAMLAIYLPLTVAISLALFLALLEIAGNEYAKLPFEIVFASATAHALIGLSFVIVIGLFVARERKIRNKAINKLNRLTTDAKDLSSPKSEPAVMRDVTQQSDVHHTRDLDTELSELMDIARLGLQADACVILLTDQYGALLRVRAMSGDPRELDEDAVIPVQGTIPGLVLSQGDPLVLQKIDRSRPPFEYRRGRANIRSCIAQPLYFEGKAIGVLIADSKKESTFDSDSENFLQKIAGQVTQAYRAAQNIAGIDRERTEFAAYYNVIKRFTQSQTLEEVIQITFDVAYAIVPHDSSLISFTEEDGTATIAAVAKLPEKWVGLKFKENESLAGGVVAVGKPLVKSSFQELKKPPYHPECRVRGLKSFIILPLTVHDRVVGTLAIFWAKENAFTQYDCKFLEVVAIHAANSLASARLHNQLEQHATTDGLTSLPNHRVFQMRLDEEIKRFQRIQLPLCLILMDIDHFKKVNDTYGHPVGDLVLQKLSKLLKGSIRDSDLAARYGGEEFALILPNTKAAGAWNFADRLRRQIAAHKIKYAQGTLSISISLGIASFPEDGANKAALITAADKALYFSKENGRNRVSWIGDIEVDDSTT
jgi:diguanylate cyclase (GGDEF)-like protein